MLPPQNNGIVIKGIYSTGDRPTAILTHNVVFFQIHNQQRGNLARKLSFICGRALATSLFSNVKHIIISLFRDYLYLQFWARMISKGYKGLIFFSSIRYKVHKNYIYLKSFIFFQAQYSSSVGCLVPKLIILFPL